MLSMILSMAAFAFVGAVTPGPVNIIATSSGATYGAVKTSPHVLGATLGYTLVVLLSGAGVFGLGQQLPAMLNVLHYLGGGFLLYMAYRIATLAPSASADAGLTQPPRLLEGALAQLLNPKAWLVATSGVALFVSSQPEQLLWLLIFSAVSFCMCLLGVAVWAISGQMLRTLLGNPARQRVFNRTLGALLAGTVILMLADHWRT
ncbi:LysE family translocator [Marinobacterium weihaiense]|uniref:LysE family translocator n=1 Tax=Marinobacterium weihaiense TaxID=2851016 RepID=A0ABS6MEW2_9GAMM|nr:LysE family translocator [Marinobacterium weihaiense]MBV0934833.1 LysE family translocator [Marinobacterium weihaiense]